MLLAAGAGDPGYDVGPSPNTVKRLRTKASNTTLSQQAIDAIETVATNSEQTSLQS